MTYLTVALNSSHKKEEFECGKELLDNYIKFQAKQDVKRKLAACFILASEDNSIQGYYTLSNAGIPREILPDQIKGKLPKSYNSLPATLLGRLAVAKAFAGQGIGQLLLMDALKRSYDASLANVASMAVIVDPIDDSASNFYSKYGFVLLPDSGKMFLVMQTIGPLFKK